jgi:hypothetical protein
MEPGLTNLIFVDVQMDSIPTLWVELPQEVALPWLR